MNHDLLVTFNGKCFDVPFLERTFGTRLRMAHVDVRFVLAKAGIRGGLKRCEHHFGMDRGGLEGVDGYWAVLLWRAFENTGDKRFLETLLAYNVEDVLRLRTLAVLAYNLLLEATPFHLSRQLAVPTPGENPVQAHDWALERIRAMYGPFL